MVKYLVAIPFYHNEEFIDAFCDWYRSSPRDRGLIYEVLVINDCPSSSGGKELSLKCDEQGFRYHENAQNIGYLHSVNYAYERARGAGVGLVLLNSDVIPFDGFLEEIHRQFALDPMLGVLSARSNNATICNMYTSPDYFEGKRSLDKYTNDFSRFVQYMPGVSYTPVVTGFCFAIKSNLVREFDAFDQIYSPGYEEENDYCLRIGERGYRVGIANHAFLVHLEGRSFGLNPSKQKIKDQNAVLMRERYPYFERLMEEFAQSIDFATFSKISTAIGCSKQMLVDARVLSNYHNGSNKVILEMLKAMSRMGINADVVAYPHCVKFHGLEGLPGINFLQDVTEQYEIGLRIAQPMNHNDLYMVPRHALRAICVYFDTIAHDCPNLRADNRVLDEVWSLLPHMYTEISFITQHAREQFTSKFGAGSAVLKTNMLPIVENEAPEENTPQPSNTALIFGNKFKHKAIDLVIDQLPRDIGYKYYVLGHKAGDGRLDIEFLEPGMISESAMDELMRNVECFIFPTFSEGFGLPMVEAVQYRKPIYCRHLPPFHEIYNALPEELKGYIRFVDDFRVFPQQSANAAPLICTIRNSGYEEYVASVIGSEVASNPDEVYQNLKYRLQLFDLLGFFRKNLSGMAWVTNQIKKLLLAVYLYLMSTWMRAPVLRLKNWAFRSPVIKKMLRPVG